MILSETPIAGPGSGNITTESNANFKFITTKGQEASYYGFNQFRIYTKETNAFVAFANIPLSLTSTKYAPGTFDNNIAPGTAVTLSSASLTDMASACLLAAYGLASAIF